MAVRADPRPVPAHRGRARPRAAALPPVRRRRGRDPDDVRRGGVVDLGRAARRRLPGHRHRARPGRPARRLRRDVRAAADRGSAPPGPGRRTSTASRSGRSPTSTLDAGRAAAAVRRGRRRAASTRRPRLRAAGAGSAGADGRRTAGGVGAGDGARGARRRPARACVYLVCAALAGLDVAVRSAHVDTLGPQAVDVFYLQEPRRRRAQPTQRGGGGGARRPGRARAGTDACVGSRWRPRSFRLRGRPADDR